MCVKEREYGMGEGEDKVARERVGDGRESRRWEREWERERKRERERVRDRRECENVRETRG